MTVSEKLDEKKFDLFVFKTQLSVEEKQRLDEGVEVELMFEKKLFKRVRVKLDFSRMQFVLSPVEYKDSITGEELSALTFKLANLHNIDKWDRNEMDQFESNFKMFFRKGIDKKLFFNLRYWILLKSENRQRVLYFVFDNEFQCSTWKSLFLLLKG